VTSPGLSDGSPNADRGDVGLEDRDWYREEPSRAWRSRWGGGAADPGYGGLGIRHGAALAVIVSVIGSALFVVWDDLPLGPLTRHANRPPAAKAVDTDVYVRTSEGLERPAVRGGRLCLDDVRFGHVCADVRAGEVPIRRLTEALGERGFRLVPRRDTRTAA
jgi:hypothetical protein